MGGGSGAKKLPQSEASVPPGWTFLLPPCGTFGGSKCFLSELWEVSSSEASAPPGGPCDWDYYETTPPPWRTSVKLTRLFPHSFDTDQPSQ